MVAYYGFFYSFYLFSTFLSACGHCTHCAIDYWEHPLQRYDLRFDIVDLRCYADCSVDFLIYGLNDLFLFACLLNEWSIDMQCVLLDGLQTVNTSTNLTWSDLTSVTGAAWRTGGEWWPINCTARYRMAIIIPFRDRDAHLKALLRHLVPMLQKQFIHFRIFVVEQVKTVSMRNKYVKTFIKW